MHHLRDVCGNNEVAEGMWEMEAGVSEIEVGVKGIEAVFTFLERGDHCITNCVECY